MKVILITGASSGKGFETSISLVKQGHKVYGSARNPEDMKNLRENEIIPLELDVTNEEQCKNAIDTIIKNDNRIDVLINNAGYGLYGAIEDISINEAKYQFEVNVFGLSRLIQNVLPHMRKQKSGKIINISSIGGKLTSFMGGWYHASKYAVESLTDALRMEISSFGIDVVLIEPSGVRTNWWKIAMEHLKQTSKGGAYEKMAEKAANGMLKLGNSKVMSNPRKIAKVIVNAINSKKPKTRYVVGFGGKSLIFLHSILPTRWYDWIVKNAMYSSDKF